MELRQAPLINKVLAKYNLSELVVEQIFPIQTGYRNQVLPFLTTNKKKYALIIYKNELGIVQRIQRANFVANYLASQGFPARSTVVTKANTQILKLSAPFHSPAGQPRYACLYHYLPGQTIDWASYSQKHLKLLGRVMSLMHEQLAQLDVAPDQLPLALAELTGQLHQMQAYFSQKKVQAAMRTKLQLRLSPTVFERQARLFEKLQQLINRHQLPIQILHLDLVRSNLLFTQQKVLNDPIDRFTFRGLQLTGILDFEKTALGPKVLDVARTLAFLLVDCKTKSPAKIYKYFIYSGYQKRGTIKLDQLELKLLPALVQYFWLYDFYKFLRHNPYECLPKNEHFLRTIALCHTNQTLKSLV